jgi:hypothetical protein
MPTERYSQMQQKWVFPKPTANIVNETNIGWDASTIYFPAVSTCTALVMAIDDNTLLGAHFDKMLSASDVGLILDHMLEKKASRSAGDLAVIGNLSYREGDAERFMSAAQYKGDQQVLTFAKKFDKKGLMYKYDQGETANKHYRVEAAARRLLRTYCADVTYVNGNPVTFDPNKVSWREQPLTPVG